MCAALFNLKAAQGHADAAGAVGQRVGLAAGLAPVDRLGPPSPRCGRATGGVLPLRAGQVAQHLGAHRIGVALGQGQVGVVGLHFGLPVAFQGRQNLLGPGAAQRLQWPRFLLAFLRIRIFGSSAVASVRELLR
jgi:hypothetical protein